MLPITNETWKTLAQSRSFRWGQASVLSAGVNFGLTVFLHEIVGLYEEWAFAIAIVTVFVLNFLVCRYYVFRSTNGRVLSQFWKYGWGSVGFRAGEYIAFLVLLNGLGFPYRPVVIAVLGLSAILKFFYQALIVFPARTASGGELS